MLPQRVVDRALEKDRARGSAEYLAEFRSDAEGFVALEVVEACVEDYREQQPVAGTSYRAFVDPSGGAADSFTMAVSHKYYRSGLVVIDAVREVRPPFSPEQVIGDFAALLKSYRIVSVTGDRYAGEFPRELFRKHGIGYELATQTKSELFRDLLPLLNSVRITLPRNDRLISQIVSLERRVSAVGKDTITHPPNGHDDLANAIAGAASLSKYGGYDTSFRWVRAPPSTSNPKTCASSRSVAAGSTSSYCEGSAFRSEERKDIMQQEIIDMQLEVVNRHGHVRPLRRGDRLADGEYLRVPHTFMDAAAQKPPHGFVRGYAFADVTPQRDQDAAAEAYEARRTRLQNAWRKNAADDNAPGQCADAAQARAVADRAWFDKKERLQNSWRMK
jgi:hypothetical protein